MSPSRRCLHVLACALLAARTAMAQPISEPRPAEVPFEAVPAEPRVEPVADSAAPVQPESRPVNPAAGGPMAFGPGSGPPGYRAAWYPNRPVANSDSDLGLVRQAISAGAPIWRDENDKLLLTVGVRHTLFFTDAILPDTGLPFPDELWNVNTGLMYTRKFENGWTAGGSVTFGSASDKPFHSIEEINLGFFGFLQKPAWNGRDAWIFSLMYSPVGNLTFPVPGIAYLWKPSDELQMSIGIPFNATWKPNNDWTLTFSYVPVVNMNARATYRLLEGLSAYGGFEWLNEAYFLADREDRRERFLAFEKRLIGGIRWEVHRHAAVDLNAGYSFDRYYGQGRNTISNLHDLVDVRPGAFVGTSLLIRW